MEADCSFVPSSTSKNEIADISLYDHCKITAAVGSCIIDYLEQEGITNYKESYTTTANSSILKKRF